MPIVTQLGQVTTLNDNDLIVVGTVQNDFTRTIRKDDFIADSIPNIPSVLGFDPVSNNPDNVTLVPSNGAEITEYYPYMYVPFISPIDSVGVVQIQVGNLPLKNLVRADNFVTSELETDGFYVAIYDPAGDRFLQVNLAENDIEGYTAVEDLTNRFTLTRAFGSDPLEYRDGLTVEFIAPANSDDLVRIRIGALDYRDLKIINTTNNSITTTGQYIHAIYIGNAGAGTFYQTNAAIPYLTNEYNVTSATINIGETITTYELESAAGVTDVPYYVGQVILFRSTIDSKGTVLLNLNGHGEVELNEGASDFIANNLMAGQLIIAQFDGVQFLKSRFAVENPPAPVLDEVIDDPVNDVVPEENLVTIYVGATRQHTTITAAIATAINEFGPDGGNRICIIQLDADFVWNETVWVDGDLSWIYINAETTINVNVPTVPNTSISCMLWSGGSRRGENRAPSLSGTYNIISWGNISGAIVGTKGMSFDFNNLTIINNANKENVIFAYKPDLEYTLTNVTLSGFKEVFGRTNGSVVINDCLFDDCMYYNGNAISVSSNGNVEIYNTTINNYNGVSNIIYTLASSNTYLENCTFNSSIDTEGFRATQTSIITAKNCRVAIDSATPRSVTAYTGGRVELDGGDYRNASEVLDNNNIVATGTGAYISLTNGVLGGSQGISGGVVETI